MELGDASPWWLADAEDRQRAAPRRFFIPPLDHRASLGEGRLVKLGFVCAPRMIAGEERAGERLWVRVSDVARLDGTYRGTVHSTPAVVPSLDSGDEVVFEPRHVFAIQYAASELGFDPAEQAAVDPLILQRDEPPTRVVRFHPPGMPDPLWLLALDGEIPDEAGLHELGKLVDFWPELGAVFAAGDGDWLRHPERAEYLADSLEHQQTVAVAALAHAAGLVLAHREDPDASRAEAHFENVLEGVVQLHWAGDGKPQGVAHPGIRRTDDAVQLTGKVRVKDAADRDLAVDIHTGDGGHVEIAGPPRKKKRLGGRRPDGEADADTLMIAVPAAPDVVDA